MLYNQIKVGDIAYYVFCEFDGSGIFKGQITECHADHVILLSENVSYWIDKEDVSESLAFSEENANALLRKLQKGGLVL